MRANSVSHLIHHPIRFEFFLFAYLVCTLLLQKINIYKTVRGALFETAPTRPYNSIATGL